MEETELIQKAKAFSEKVIANLDEAYCYHNLEHTRDVVEAAKEIAAYSNLEAEDLENVITAAWFHDTGYSEGFENHEDESVAIMKKKLTEWKVVPEKIFEIGKIIESTKMPQNPKDLPSQVLCDADLHHLSTDSFKERSESLRKELTETCNKKLPKARWREINCEFLASHKYFTNYGKTVLEPKKQKNLAQALGADDSNGKPKKADKKHVKALEKEVIKLKNKLDKTKEIKPDRGIETMFRITSKNHLTLSGMADNKANIMISINSIILSILVSVLFRKFEEYPNLIVPGLMLTLVCLTTIVFAILATRPNVTSGKFKREDIINKKTNLLFFGNFHSMELDNYMWGMKQMMKDADFLYGSLTKDIYFLGRVLGKKYRMLRISYTVFMFGFVISVLAFVVALFLFPVH